MFTIQTFNQSVLQPAGAVFAQRVEAVSLLRDFVVCLLQDRYQLRH